MADNFVGHFKKNFCTSFCETGILDNSKLQHAHLPLVADVCSINNTFRVGNILVDQYGKETYLLCDLIGIPVAHLIWGGDKWTFVLANYAIIKDRGSDRSVIESAKIKYIVNNIKKNYKYYIDLMPSTGKLLSRISDAFDTANDAIVNGSYVSQSTSITIDAMIALMDALQSGSNLNTLPGPIQYALNNAHDNAKRSVATRDRIETEFKNNIIDKEFYAVAELDNSGLIVVTKIKANSTTRKDFLDSPAISRFRQTAGIHVFRSLENMKETMPGMGGDIEFQAEMMRHALHGVTTAPLELYNLNKDKLLGMNGEEKYVRELNLLRSKSTNGNFLSGRLTMMEVV
jgi:hypothetical protein